LDIFKSALEAVQPGVLLGNRIKREGDRIILGHQVFSRKEIRHFYIIAMGKAASAMGDTLEQILGDTISEGIIVTKYGHGLPMEYLSCMEAGHPVPDQNGLLAGRAVVHLLNNMQENDLVLVLLSGGSSSLVADVVPGVTLTELQSLSKLLLKCGADIREFNTVRKHLSLLKGGQLARLAYPATVVCFALSDVPGDAADVIASGPVVPDPTTYEDAWGVIKKYKLEDQLGKGILDWMARGRQGRGQETPKAGDPVFEKTSFSIIGNNLLALQAAAAAAKEKGYHVLIDDSTMHGEARERAIQLAMRIETYEGPRPACILLGGETTVTVRGTGRGGRNQEFALALLCHWQSSGKDPQQVPSVLCAATDGTDGPTDAAGALVDGRLLNWLYVNKLDAGMYLEQNDSYTFFQKTEAQLLTGPTYTNVMDMVIVLIT